MLEPRGADSRTSVGHASDDSARFVRHASDALLEGRIRDALDLVDQGRRDDDLDDHQRAVLALTGLLARLALGDTRGAAPYSRDLTALVRVRGEVSALSCFGLGEVAAARGQVDQAVAYYERVGDELGTSSTWVPWRSGLARQFAGRGEVSTATRLVEEELADARVLHSPYAVAYALRTQAAMAPTQDRLAPARRGPGGGGRDRRLSPRGPDPHRRGGLAAAAAPGPSRRAPSTCSAPPRSTPARRSSRPCCRGSAGCSNGSARHPTASCPAGWPS